MKNVPLFPHKTFLHQNGIEVDKLPDALQKRIYGFEELEHDLSSTVDQDREKLLSRMEDLSHELDEDLEEHFEDELDNNDDLEEVHAGASTESSAPDKHECACKHAKQALPHHEDKPAEEPHAPLEGPTEAVPMLTPEPKSNDLTDEQILANLLDAGWHKILPDDLRSKGFRAPLTFKVIAVGKFYLRKGRYETHYRILRAWD